MSSNAEANEELRKIKKTKTKEVKEKAAMAELQIKRKDKKRMKVKKVYDLPGQKWDSPTERDPLRIFYETLYKELPHNEMAQLWMMESGLLSEEEAKKIHKNRQKMQKRSCLEEEGKKKKKKKKKTLQDQKLQ